MKYSFVKDFPGIGACDAYVGAIVSGKKEKRTAVLSASCWRLWMKNASAEKRGSFFSANLFHEGKLMTCVFAGLGEKATSKSVETAFAGAVKRQKAKARHGRRLGASGFCR